MSMTIVCRSFGLVFFSRYWSVLGETGNQQEPGGRLRQHLSCHCSFGGTKLRTV